MLGRAPTSRAGAYAQQLAVAHDIGDVEQGGKLVPIVCLVGEEVEEDVEEVGTHRYIRRGRLCLTQVLPVI